jgi:hypothetical protein
MEVHRVKVLIRIRDHPKDRVPELLPHRWKTTFGSGFSVPRVETPRDEEARPAHGGVYAAIWLGLGSPDGYRGAAVAIAVLQPC